MPTLASVHGSQATISVELRSAQRDPALHRGMDSLDAAEVLLDHSKLHLLLCPWQKPMQQALQALAGSKKAAQAVGNYFTLICIHHACQVCQLCVQLGFWQNMFCKLLGC